MSLTIEYFRIQKKSEVKYGGRTVVLIQVGSFYEIYEYDPLCEGVLIADINKLSIINSRLESSVSDDNKSIDTEFNTQVGHALDISVLIHLFLTCRDKSKPHSISNPFMIGIPCSSYERYRETLISNDWTIVRVDQLSNGSNTERDIVEVASAATEIDNIMPNIVGTNQIVSIYIECQKPNKRNEDYTIISGMSVIDIATSENLICEVYSQHNNNTYALHEIYRFLSSHQPREVIVHLQGFSKNKIQIDYYCDHIFDVLELQKYPTLIFKTDIDLNYLDLKYQEQFLNKIFNPDFSKQKISGPKLIVKTGNDQKPISFIEKLDLERLHYGRISYLALLQYCYDHNEMIVKNIKKPKLSWVDEKNHLILTHNAINQLDILPPSSTTMARTRTGGIKKVDSLITVLDNTSTVPGKRLLRSLLLNPILDVEKLNRFYGMTEELVNDQDILKKIELLLRQIPDIENLQRKLAIGAIRPNEFCSLFRSYIKIIELYSTLTVSITLGNSVKKPYLQTLLLTSDQINDFNKCLHFTLNYVDLEKLEKAKILGDRMNTEFSFIIKGKEDEIDQLVNNILACEQHIIKVCNHFNGFLIKSTGKMIEPSFDRKKKADDEFEMNDISVTISTTTAKANILKSNLHKIDKTLCGDLVFTAGRTTTTISSSLIQHYCNSLEQSKAELEKKLYIAYKRLLSTLSKDYTFFSSLNTFIAMLDYVKSNARTAIRFKYFKPTIVETAPISFISLKNARHPIIEQIISSEYITNDISLGWSTDHDKTDSGIKNELENKIDNESIEPLGCLLFGMNSTGKTSIGKLIALLIIMAQAGMFVPALMKYKPYTKIITRLSGNDDLLKGHSSFVVEMLELRTILRNADSSTFVSADEMAKGTETISATSITVAAVQFLIDKKTSFIFATHMHHIPTIPIIEKLNQNQLRICHLTAVYDERLDELVYERKLKEGPGSSIYGLEVCKSLSIDKKFIEQANVIRKELANIPPLILNNKKSRYNTLVRVDLCSICGTNVNLQSHHIREQIESGPDGFIDHFHKNREFNIMVLCQKCHQNLHDNNLQIKPKQTLSGTIYEIM